MRILLLLLSAFKFKHLFVTGGTMLLSIVTYAQIFGWKFACGFVLLIFCHEMGHYIAAKHSGLNVGAPTFIPFIGAWIELKEQPMDAKTEAYVGIAGPLLGSIAALVCYFLARSMDSELLLALSYSGFFINLFNLIPVPPLDGGRIVVAISRKIWLIGAPLFLGFILWRPSIFLIIIGILLLPQVIQSFKSLNAKDAYYEVDTNTRFEYGLLYIGLVIFLAFMTNSLYERLS